MTDSVQTPQRVLATRALAVELKARDPHLRVIVGGRAIDIALVSAGDLGVERDPCLVLDALEGMEFDRAPESTA